MTRRRSVSEIATRILDNPRSSPDARSMASAILHQSVIHPVALPVKSYATVLKDPKASKADKSKAALALRNGYPWMKR